MVMFELVLSGAEAAKDCPRTFVCSPLVPFRVLSYYNRHKLHDATIESETKTVIQNCNARILESVHIRPSGSHFHMACGNYGNGNR
jgi:hypothetical protein